MRQATLALALAALGLGAGCGKTRCEDLVPEPLPGTYVGGGSLGQARLLQVGVEATEREVVLTYTDLEGARIRAKYLVMKKTRVDREAR